MPSPGLSEMPSFATSQEFPDSPSASSPSSTSGGQSNSNLQATFYERLTGLPLVRAGVARVKDVYRTTKDRHELIRAALEAGEDTVHASMSRAAGLLHKSGLSERLQGPLSLAESSACFVLDKVEANLPIITKSPYEIKLMISDNVDAKKDQFAAVKESTVRLYDGYKSLGTQTIEEAKQIGTEKVQAVLETPVGQKLNETLERGLTIADSAVDLLLPERGHAHKPGNGTANGHAHSHSNGSTGHIGTYDHAKCLSLKLKRRVSAKSSDVVDSVLQNPMVSSVAGVAWQNIAATQHVASIVYDQIATVTGKVADFCYSTTLFLLPKPVHDKFAVVMNGLVDRLLTYRHGASS